MSVETEEAVEKLDCTVIKSIPSPPSEFFSIVYIYFNNITAILGMHGLLF